MHVVIVGCGWLGTELGRRLVEQGHTVSGVRRDPAAAGALARHGIEPRIADVSVHAGRQLLPGTFDALICCQAAGRRDLDTYRKTYVAVNRELGRLARDRGVERWIYTGSTGVFDQSGGAVVDEATRIEPTSERAELLREAELAVLESAGPGLVPCVVRLSGLYGPGRYGVVERVRQGLLALGPGDEAWMNWCHLEDAARVVLAALDRGTSGAVYHATDAHPTRRRDVVGWIADRLGIEPPTISGAGAAPPPRHRQVRGEWSREQLGVSLAFASFREGLIPGFAAR